MVFDKRGDSQYPNRPKMADGMSAILKHPPAVFLCCLARARAFLDEGCRWHFLDFPSSPFASARARAAPRFQVPWAFWSPLTLTRHRVAICAGGSCASSDADVV